MSGVIVLDKPRGPTSMSMVNMIRRKCHKSKTGHAGTLDPLATGVLVLGIGQMTKQLGKLMATNKAYETVIDLSGVTDGHDEESEPKIRSKSRSKTEFVSGPIFWPILGAICAQIQAGLAVETDTCGPAPAELRARTD